MPPRGSAGKISLADVQALFPDAFADALADDDEERAPADAGGSTPREQRAEMKRILPPWPTVLFILYLVRLRYNGQNHSAMTPPAPLRHEYQ